MAPICYAVVGAGTIGLGWAIVFSDAGHTVSVYDKDPVIKERFYKELEVTYRWLEGYGLVTSSFDDITARIRWFDSLEEAIYGADFIQENIIEDLSAKKELFYQIERYATGEAIVASSSSMLTASEIASELKSRYRCLVIHPINPPYIMRFAEVVPAEFTSEQIVSKAVGFLRSANVDYIVLQREIRGFVFNRLQGAVLVEAYNLVGLGVVKPRDLEKLVVKTLGRRWSVIGPFAAVDLNTRGGLREHARRLGKFYTSMHQDQKVSDWTVELVEKVAADIDVLMDNKPREQRLLARDAVLAELYKAFETDLIHKLPEHI